MSFSLPKIDLSLANVGDEFFIDLSNAGIPKDFINSREPAHLRMYNDSCMGLDCSTQTDGHQFYVPQGAWPTIEIRAQETGVNILCSSQSFPVPSICFLKPVWYGPGEPLDDLGVLGNTPMNLSGTVNVTSANNLSNETNNPPFIVIDIGVPGHTNLISIVNNGSFVWSELIAGVVHTLMQGSLTGSPLQLGQGGGTPDVTEILGTLLIDKILHNGSAPPTGSGTADIYQFNIGSIKLVWVDNNNLQNTNASKFSVALPVAFTAKANVFATDISPTDFLLGGVAQNLTIATGLAVGGGTTGTQNFIQPFSIAGIPFGFDTLRFAASNASVHHGGILIVGS